MPKPANELATIEEKATTLSITNPQDLAQATELLSQVNRYKDAILAEKDKVMRPILDAANAERARWKPEETKLEIIIIAIRKEITTYQTAAKATANDQKQAVVARIGSGRGHITLDTATTRLEAIDEPQAIVSTQSGSLRFRTMDRFEITDIAKLPAEYLLPNEPAIRQAQKAKTAIEGVRYFTEEVPINSR